MRTTFDLRIALLLAFAGCSAKYETGVTKCSADLVPRCPAGFTCQSGVCISDSAPSGGSGGSATGGSGTGGKGTGGMGTGGMGGTSTGGMPGTGGMGTGGMGTGGMGTGGTGVVTCDDPMHPVSCPARNGVIAACWTPGVDCNTVTKCGTANVGCAAGYMSNCAYPANPCSPVGNKCSADSIFCPALGQVGPACYKPGIDCSTVTLCQGEVAACRTGTVPDCASGNCVPRPTTTCTDPAVPQSCPAKGDVPATCIPANFACSTLTLCAGTPAACASADTVYDCGRGVCPPAAACVPADPTDPCIVCASVKCCGDWNACAQDATCLNTGTGPVADALNACLALYCGVECK